MIGDRAKKNQMARLKQKKDDYCRTFGTASGKRVLKDLEENCYIHKSTYSEKPGGTFINEGLRLSVVNIQNIMDFDLQTLNKIVQEGD